MGRSVADATYARCTQRRCIACALSTLWFSQLGRVVKLPGKLCRCQKGATSGTLGGVQARGFHRDKEEGLVFAVVDPRNAHRTAEIRSKEMLVLVGLGRKARSHSPQVTGRYGDR